MGAGGADPYLSAAPELPIFRKSRQALTIDAAFPIQNHERMVHKTAVGARRSRPCTGRSAEFSQETEIGNSKIHT